MCASPLRAAGLAILALFLLTAHNLCSANPKKWIELRTPHFVVVTNASEHDARQAAEQFDTIRAVFREYFKTVSANDQPLVIVAASDESTFKPLLPEAWTQKGAAQRAGVYLKGLDKSYIYLRLDVPYETIYHEYIHYLMRRMNPKLPTWMVEGLAEFYANVRIESKKVLVGAPSASNLRILSQRTPLPLTTLFEVNASSPYYNEESKISIFYAESWALTHYLMARDWDENTHRLSDFIGLLGPNVSQVDAARKTIGDPAVLEPALNEYVRKLAFTAARIDKPEIPKAGHSTRELSEAESLAVRADLVAHQGQYAKAQTMLEESIKLDPKLALAFQVMAFSYNQQGKIADAEQSSSRALALDPQNYLANYYHAASLLRGTYFDEHSLANAIAGLQAVIATNPDFAPAYDALAYALARPGSHQKLDEAHKTALRAVELDPANLLYRVHVAQVLAQMGRADDALNIATVAASMARTPAELSLTSAALSAAQKFQASQKKSQESGAASSSATPSDGADGQANSPQSNLPIQNSLEFLTDTMGVDFASYLSGVNQSIHKSWLTLVPDVVRPPTTKKGKVVIEWSITKDGSPADLRLVSSSNDAALDRAASDAITSSAPFPPLPADFKGPFVAIRLTFLYNPGPADPALSESIWRLETRFRENLNTDKNADADLNRELVTLTSLLSSGKLGKADDLMARSYRASTLQAMNNLREQRGEKVDLVSAQQALDDFDQVIASAAAIPSAGITAEAAQYYAGQVAFQIKSETLAYSYWNKCAELSHSGCLYNLAAAHLTGEGGEKVDFQQSLDLYHKLFDRGLNAQCWSSYSALRIAKLAYFLDVRQSPADDPLAWIQKSYDRSAQVAARAQQKTACDVDEAKVEEFLYRLGRGERKNDLLGHANNDSDLRIATTAATKYFAGAIDEKAFEAAAASSHSDGDRCFAYFEAMWFSESTKNHAAARTYYDRMLEHANLRCRAEIVFARKFGFQN